MKEKQQFSKSLQMKKTTKKTSKTRKKEKEKKKTPQKQNFFKSVQMNIKTTIFKIHPNEVRC